MLFVIVDGILPFWYAIAMEKKIVEMYQSGYSQKQVAIHLGLTAGKVRYVLQKAKATRTYSETARLRFNKLVSEKELHEMYLDKKMSAREIGEKVGAPTSTVHHQLKRLGIPRRQPLEFSTLRDYRFCKRGAEHPSWKGGRIKTPFGYVLVYAPEHPRHNSRGYIPEHILVWEQTHGRELPKGWEVHHLNGTKDDNRPENLLGLPSRQHKQIIRSMRQRIRELESQVKELKAASQLDFMGAIDSR